MYVRHRRMQSGNSRLLLDILRGENGKLPLGFWLDIGCGVGDLLAAAHAEGGLRGGGHVGIDLSPVMVELASERNGEIAQFQVADAADLPFDDESFDVVASNSALHWLNAPEEKCTPKKAFAEIKRVLKKSGSAAFSISATGTARRFQAAYVAVYDRHPEWRERSALFRPDPIGNMQLADIVAQATATGLRVVDAVTRYEPVTYDNAGQYADDVAAYGLGPYTVAFAPSYRDAAWKAIVAGFRERVGDGLYVHDQFMSYVFVHRADANLAQSPRGTPR